MYCTKKGKCGSKTSGGKCGNAISDCEYKAKEAAK